MQDYVPINDTRLYCSITGEGEPLVLLHGGASDLRIWDHQVETLARTLRVIRYDQRGYGKSDIPVSLFSYVDDLRGLIDALKLERVSVIGSSLGGSVAIDFALKYPERIRSLILVGPALSGYRYPARFMIEGIKLLLAVRFRGREAAIEKFIAG